MNRTRLSMPAALAGALSLVLLILLLLVGCDGFGCGGTCPTGTPGLSASNAPVDPQANVGRSRFDWGRLVCRWLPPLCDWSPCADPFEPLFVAPPSLPEARPGDGALWGEFHGALLDAWRASPLERDALLSSYLGILKERKLEAAPIPVAELGAILDAVLDGALALERLPGIGELRCAFATPGAPFAQADGLDELLAGLEDGVSARDAAGFAAFAADRPADRPDERAAADLMAASVGWWAGYEEETGRISSLGVSADLSAISSGADFRTVAIASGVGLVLDLLDRFFD